MPDLYGVNSSSSSNMLRITGLATGMDTDTMVKKMMAAENMKLDKMNQDKQYNQWKQEAIRDITKDFRDLRDKYLLLESPADTNLMKSFAYSGSTITATDSLGKITDSLVTASALPGAVNGVSKIKVLNIAETAKIIGTNLTRSDINNKEAIGLSTTLSELGVKTGTIKITIPEGTANVDVKEDMTVQKLIDAIYKAKIDGKEQNLYSKVRVSFSELTQSLTVESRETGENINGNPNTISISNMDTSNDIIGQLKLNGTQGKGKDASVEITPPGSSTSISLTKSTNNFTIDNVTYNLLRNPQGTEDTVTLNTKADSQKTVDRIKDFIGKYNELMKKITDKISEKKDYSYKPLTYDQRKEMKEDDIKKWEEKAQKGILKNDSDLEQIVSRMRRAFTGEVENSGLNLKKIGIETYGGLEAITKPGQLQINETKLKVALETRGDQVMNLFTARYEGTVPPFPDKNSSSQQIKDYENYKTNKYYASGIFQRIENIINDSAVTFDGSLLKKAGFEGTASNTTNELTKKMKEQDKKIKEMAVKFSEKENYYYNMFAKLEVAMNKMNAQQSWLAQQLGGGR